MRSWKKNITALLFLPKTRFWTLSSNIIQVKSTIPQQGNSKPSEIWTLFQNLYLYQQMSFSLLKQLSSESHLHSELIFEVEIAPSQVMKYNLDRVIPIGFVWSLPCSLLSRGLTTVKKNMSIFQERGNTTSLYFLHDSLHYKKCKAHDSPFCSMYRDLQDVYHCGALHSI